MSMHTVAVMGLGVRGKIHLHGLLENPDYYKVGDIVYFQSPGYLWGSGEYAEFGPKYPA